jgi:hypothetical protein
MILLGILIFIVLTIALYSAVALLLDTLKECPFKKKEKPYMDNSEYDWGHNVKHTYEEEL